MEQTGLLSLFLPIQIIYQGFRIQLAYLQVYWIQQPRQTPKFLWSSFRMVEVKPLTLRARQFWGIRPLGLSTVIRQKFCLWIVITSQLVISLLTRMGMFQAVQHLLMLMDPIPKQV